MKSSPYLPALGISPKFADSQNPLTGEGGEGGGTLGSGTFVCDTSTQIGPFRAKWTQNYSI